MPPQNEMKQVSFSRKEFKIRIKLRFIENKTTIQPLPIWQDFGDDQHHNPLKQ